MSLRILNVLIGTWLFVSAFMWPHSPLEAAFTMACGGLSVVFALATIYNGGFRYLNAGLAVVLFISSIVLSGWRGPILPGPLRALQPNLSARWPRPFVQKTVRR